MHENPAQQELPSEESHLKMEDSVNNSGCNVVEEILKHIDGEADSAAKIVEVTSLLTSLVCMVLTMIVNTYIIVNILHKRKFKVRLS